MKVNIRNYNPKDANDIEKFNFYSNCPINIMLISFQTIFFVQK